MPTIALICFAILVWRINRTPITKSERRAAAVQEAIARWDSVFGSL